MCDEDAKEGEAEIKSGQLPPFDNGREGDAGQ
jgi:hypothetical protein